MIECHLNDPLIIFLLIMAILARMLADGLPRFFMTGVGTAVLIGFSMVPRAEITAVITQTGDWAVPAGVYAAMAVVSAAPCILSPLLPRRFLKRQFPGAEEKG